MSGERPTPPRPTRAITYYVPRDGRRRWPVAASGVVLLGALVAGQAAVAASSTPPPVASGPTSAPTSAPTSDPTGAATGDPTGDPTGAATGGPRAEPTLEPVAPPRRETPDPDLRAVDEVTIPFTAGSVLDPAALDAVAGLADVLAAADAAPAVVVGYAEPGPDEAAALRLATSRAEAVVAALVERGVPEQLLRVEAVVDAGAGRSVVVGPERP